MTQPNAILQSNLPGVAIGDWSDPTPNAGSSGSTWSQYGVDSWLNIGIGTSFPNIQPGLQPALASYNVALGALTMPGLTTGNYNTCIGTSAGQAITNAIGNTLVGTQAGKTTTAGNNTAVGQSALASNTTGAANTVVGWNALSAAVSASWNTAIGYQAGLNIAAANGSNTCVGAFAGDALVNSGNNTHVGFKAGYGGSDVARTTLLGQGTSATGAGAVAIGVDSAGNSSTAAANVFALGTANHQVQILNNTTGAGTASFTANCPAATPAGAYTWFKMMAGDGSTVYVPAWK